MSAHVPVLLEEAVSALRVRPGGRYIDGTFGRGGHSSAIAARGGSVLGIDRDMQAIEEWESARAGLDPEVAARISLVHGNHGDIADIARGRGWDGVDGVLLDLGVSSPQLDEAERGFSFMRDGPLDMRMDRTRGATAADIVNGATEEELANIFRRFGEEPRAWRIARAIASERGPRPFSSTLQLAATVERSAGRHSPRHPATRVFQALRMAVNDETGELERALEGALGLLRPGGVFAVIVFESITSRIVKRFFAAHEGREASLPQGGSRWCGELPRVRRVGARATAPGKEEATSNRRARSAKLRAVEVVE